MGQKDSKQIQQNVAILQSQNFIQHLQGQKFLHDYHTNDPGVQDVKTFQDNKLKMFLKYFILQKYSGKLTDKQNTKRILTNQSSLSQEQRNLDNLAGTLCFQTYKVEENYTKICKLINKLILTKQSPEALNLNQALKEVLDLVGIKQCNLVIVNKNNIIQLKTIFSSVRGTVTIENNSSRQSPFVRGLKYKLRKAKKSQLIQDKILVQDKQLQSQVFYVQEIPTKQNTCILVLSFKDLEVIEMEIQNKQILCILERFLTQIGDFLIKLSQLSQIKVQNHTQIQLNCQNQNNKQILQQTKHQMAQVCWNFLKIYKSSSEFQNSNMIQKIKSQNKRKLNLTKNDCTIQQIKQKVIQHFKSSNHSLQQGQNQIVEFVKTYQSKYLSVKNDLSQYLQKYFLAITQDVLQMVYDSNTELKILISSGQAYQNYNILRNIQQISSKCENPTLSDVFKQQKDFQQFYKKSYKQAYEQLGDQSKFQYDEVRVQFKFKQEVIQRIKISIFPQSLILGKKSRNVRQTSKTRLSSAQKKAKFSSFHNTPDSYQRDISNKQNRQSITTVIMNVKASSKKISNILDPHQIQTQSCLNLYDAKLNVLEIQQTKQIQLAYKIMFQMDFYKKHDNRPAQKLISFLQNLKEEYNEHTNPFHNFAHGVNVMHTAFMLCSIKKITQILSDFSKFVLVLSALCHDVGHTGFNNAFQIASNSPLAQTYNDISPLQNYHISKTLKLLKNQQNDFLTFLTSQQKINLRKLMISNILNTDMKQHFNVLKKFEDSKSKFKQNNFQDEKVISGMLIHSSDFGGSIKQFQICRQWSRFVNQQFKLQSLRQHQLNFTLSPFMLNLDKEIVIAKNQFGFLKFMVQPLYKSISQTFFDDEISTSMFKRVNQNIQQWQLVIKKLTV